MSNEITESLRASQAAAAAGNIDEANATWRHYVGLLEVSMKRTGSADHLTPAREQEQRA